MNERLGGNLGAFSPKYSEAIFLVVSDPSVNEL
jgi:hypothetical protein